MTEQLLRIPQKCPSLKSLTASEFIWRPHSNETSFHTNISPQLTDIGAVPEANADFISLAILVFLADRTVHRPSKGWERDFTLRLPTFKDEKWSALTHDISSVLRVLSGDKWTVTFDPRSLRQRKELANRPDIDRVVLFSGGADSLCGAIHALERGERVLLVSHWDWSGHSGYQKHLAGLLARRYPDMVCLRQHRVSRRSRQVGSNESFGDEPTRRSRSFLFVALGLAYASLDPSLPLWIAENGYTALNLPLAGERIGALSTRTTHPIVLDGISSFIANAGGYGGLSNPFELMTKGELFRVIRGALGADDASMLLSASHSCAHVRWAAGTGLAPSTQCGICNGCLVRRAAFLAADISDQTTYIHTVLSLESRPKRVNQAAKIEVRTVRYAGARGISPADLLALGLPQRVHFESSLDVSRRGLAELVTAVDTLPDLRVVE